MEKKMENEMEARGYIGDIVLYLGVLWYPI